MTSLNLKLISNEELVQRLLKLRQSERKITHLILIHILEMESRRLYAELGYESLFSYLTKGLGYSESGAYRRLQSARLLKSAKNKENITEKLEQGSLNLSQLTQVHKALKQAQKESLNFEKSLIDKSRGPNRSERPQSSQSSLAIQESESFTGPTLEVLLEKIQNKSTFETQRVLSEELNLPPERQETLKPQRDQSVTLALNFSSEEFQALEQAKSLLSHICPEGKWANVIVELAKRLNQQKLGRAEKRIQLALGGGHETSNSSHSPRSPSLTQSLTETVKPSSSSSKRKYISVHVKRELLKHAQHCCQYRDPQSGKVCGGRFQLQIDHIKPLAFGGRYETSNLRVLCRTHNLLMANKMGLMKL